MYTKLFVGDLMWLLEKDKHDLLSKCQQIMLEDMWNKLY